MRSVDIAVNILDKSIERGNEDPSYYMDFVKLHKLLYLGQCYLSFKYEMDLFKDKITATDDGPYVDGLKLIPVICGFDEIKTMDEFKQCKMTLPLTFSRDETVDYILDKFGKYSTEEIVKFTKDTIGYQEVYGKSCNNEINKELMIKTGKSLFGKKGKQKKIIDLNR